MAEETRKQSIRNGIIATMVTGAFAAAAIFGGTAIVNASNTQSAEMVAAAKQADMVVQANAAQQEMSQSSSVEAGKIAAQEKAEQEAAAAQAAAEAQAEAETAAQAEAQRQTQAAADAASSDSSNDSPAESGGAPAQNTASGQPSGTPLPMAQVTDPNNGQYGQMVPTVDPASWCANHSASTINGVPTCD